MAQLVLEGGPGAERLNRLVWIESCVQHLIASSLSETWTLKQRDVGLPFLQTLQGQCGHAVESSEVGSRRVPESIQHAGSRGKQVACIRGAF